MLLFIRKIQNYFEVNLNLELISKVNFDNVDIVIVTAFRQQD